MSNGYRAVSWTPFKRRFDAWMLAGVAVYLCTFVGVSSVATPPGESFTAVQMLIRATGTLAFVLLSFVLCIGPLARLTPRFKPFLYNRRHLGVLTFLIGLVHGALVLVWYHGFGALNPLVSLLVSNPRYGSLQGFPFESLGLVALCLLLLLAATSHDFWNTNLGPRLWKAIHLSVYAAYALLVAHVTLGVMLYESHPIYWLLLMLGPGVVAALQLYTAFFASDRVRPTKAHAGAHAGVHARGLQGWLKVGPALDIRDQRATVIETAGAQRIAVFRYGGKVSAVSNVCRHQGGPLGEGRIVDGCITCPWHGFQYRPEDGCSPAPFNERIATFATRIEHGVVYVHPKALQPGTYVAPSIMDPAGR